MILNDNPDPASRHVCDLRRHMALARSHDALDFELLGRFDAESDGFGISYPDFIEHDGLIYAVTSRRDRRATARPNLARGHVLALD